jgi:hypothetical protein
VALSNMYPEAKSVGQWFRPGWRVALACVANVFCLLPLVGWHPQPLNKGAAPAPAPAVGAPGYQ